MWNWRNSNLKQKFLAQDAVTNLKSLLCIFNYTCIREPRNTFVIAIYGKEDHVWEIFIKSVIFNSLVLIWFCNLVLAVPSSAAAMKVINTNQLVEIPDGVEASVKSRVVTVKVRKKGRAVKFPLSFMRPKKTCPCQIATWMSLSSVPFKRYYEAQMAKFELPGKTIPWSDKGGWKSTTKYCKHIPARLSDWMAEILRHGTVVGGYSDTLGDRPKCHCNQLSL